MNRHPRVFTLIYFVSSILDVADGKAARMLDQTSKFGGVLDMVTDRWAQRSSLACIEPKGAAAD
jgi:CDP-diacylglycerol--inositol 3-phosphatidyltransferase